MTATITLRERVGDVLTVTAWLDEHMDEIAALDGALPPELEALLNDADEAFDEKVERLARVYKRLSADADANAQEEAHYAQRRRFKSNAAERLRTYCLHMMQAAGRDEVHRPLADVAIAKSPPSVSSSVDDLALRGPAFAGFVTVEPERYTLDKKAVLAAYRAGAVIPPGVSVVTTNKNLRIR